MSVGRPERELEPRGSLRQLARWLRAQRVRSGLTYREMAEATGVPATTLSRAASSTTLPSRRTVQAFAEACGADAARGMRLLAAAESDVRRSRGGRIAGSDYRRGVYFPENVTSSETLVRALIHLRLRTGQLSYAELSRRARRNGHTLPSSTISDLLTGRSRPRSLATVLALVRACGESDEGLPVWRDAWQRAHGTDLSARLGISARAARRSAGAEGEATRSNPHRVGALASSDADQFASTSGRQALSKGERVVARHLIEGLSTDQIAQRLKVGMVSVDALVRRVRRKLAYGPELQLDLLMS